MKKLQAILMTAAAVLLSSCGPTATGQATTSNTSNGTVTGTAIGNILGNVLGLDKVTQDNIVGTWTYYQPGCAFSSDNLLAKAGGEVAAAKIKSELGSTYQRVGISSSNTQVTFNKDQTFTAKIGGKSLSGKYTIDTKTSKITLKSLLLNINCYAKRNVTGISLLFESSKLLTLLQTVAAVSGDASVQTIGDLSKNYDGLQLGFDMK